MRKQVITLILISASIINHTVVAKTSRYRAMWRKDPATTMVIGWDQVSGSNPVLRYDTKDYGNNPDAYQFSQQPDRIVKAKGMNNHFVRLENLQPNTTYFFLIQDSEGSSTRFSFQTTSNTPHEPISIIAGGDSRNHREARRKANQLVSKLRPHLILFSGDMTNGDQSHEWKDWFDDWQLTIGSDGRISPIVATRGNHEATNETVVNLFDVPSNSVYYDLSFGSDLLKVFTLNTGIPSGGNQRIWLAKNLENSNHFTWRIAQYHTAMRPHSSRKPEKNNLIADWATLFHKYRVQVAIESDAHVVKWTYPIRPSRAPGSAEGFVRDDDQGTVYIGEGCWGAPLRQSDDPKPWTRDSDSFNQFKWIFVSEKEIAIRTLRIDQADQVQEISHFNPFDMPPGIEKAIWRPANGSVIEIPNKDYRPIFPIKEETVKENPPAQPTVKLLKPDPITRNITLDYRLEKPTDVFIVLKNTEKTEINRYKIPDQVAGPYSKSLNFSKLKDGIYYIDILAGSDLVANFKVENK